MEEYYRRTRPTQIFEQIKNTGKRIDYAQAWWRCFSTTVQEAKQNLENILKDYGYDISALQERANAMVFLLKNEEERGTHQI